MLKLWIVIWIAMLAGGTLPASAAQHVHLLGFVEHLCVDEPYCFELRAEPKYIKVLGEIFIVRFDRSALIFDPEYYEVTPEQSNIVDGSHLRLLLIPDSSRGRNHYRASVIWIGE